MCQKKNIDNKSFLGVVPLGEFNKNFVATIHYYYSTKFTSTFENIKWYNIYIFYLHPQ